MPILESSQLLSTNVQPGFDTGTLTGAITLEADSNFNLNSYPGSPQRFFLYTSIGVTDIVVSSTAGSLSFLGNITLKKEDTVVVTSEGVLKLKYPLSPDTIPNVMVIGKPINYGGMIKQFDGTWLVKSQDLSKNYMMVILLIDYLTTMQYWQLTNTFLPLASYDIGIIAVGTNPLLRKI